MGRIIEGQTITTTHLDSHGERISRDDLITMFDRRPSSSQMGDNHDLSKIPVCRSFNERLEDLPDGELAWKVDLEVFDEEAFSRFGGFSIGFTRRHVRFGHGEVEAKVTINTRQFDLETVVTQVKNALNGTYVVEVVERVEKADVVVAAIIGIVASIGSEIAGGFFKAIGADLFNAAKKFRRKDMTSAPTNNIHFHLHLQPEAKTPIVLLAVDPSCTTEDVRDLTEASVLAAVKQHVALHQLERAVATLRPGGNVDVEFVTNHSGEIVYRKNHEA